MSNACHIISNYLSYIFRHHSIVTGRYVEFNPSSIEAYVEGLKQQYKEFLRGMALPPVGAGNTSSVVFTLCPHNQSMTDAEMVKGMNTYIFCTLSRANWGVPSSNPSVKYHKDPIKVRPIVCKRGTPSIAVGYAVRYVLEKLR